MNLARMSATGQVTSLVISMHYLKRSHVHIINLQYDMILPVTSMYTKAKTVVRKVYGNGNCSEVKVSMHQGSALSPLLFVIVMEASSTEFRVALPWELLYVKDLVVIAESEDDLIKRLK